MIKEIDTNNFLEEAKKVIVDGAEFFFIDQFRYNNKKWGRV